MGSSSNSRSEPRIVRFGEFEVDFAAGELRSCGRKVKLQDQPFRLLSVLVRRPGEIVSREELQANLWPAGTVVEFEHSINTALKKIRQALGDSAANPEFVETVPRHGYRFRATLEQPPDYIRSLAILPLENMSGNRTGEYFCDGMTEALISHLGRIGAVRVISRTSIMRYKGSRRPLPEIAKELNVDAVIEGSTFWAEGRVRITIRLLDARTDRHLWATSYERDVRDVLELQRDVAQAVALQMRVTLTAAQRLPLTRLRSVSPDVLEAYLKGRYHWNRRSEMKLALQCFQQAIELDPSYALAYVGLADCYRKLGENHIFPPSEAFPMAKAAAVQALELDEELAEAHVAMGAALTNLDWDWPAAEGQFRRALDLNPSCAAAHEEFAWLLSATSRSREAVAEAQKALQLDPFSPVKRAHLAMALYSARSYVDAIEEFRRSVDTLPESVHFPPIRSMLLGLALAQCGRQEECISVLGTLKSRANNSAEILFPLAYAHAVAGRRFIAEELILKLKNGPTTYALPFYLASIYTGLGDWEIALDCLEQAHKERVWLLTRINASPTLDPLREHPRFRDLLEQMNLRNYLLSPGTDVRFVAGR